MPTATCLCGACHIVIDSILGTGICHCITCRKSTSSTFSLNAVTTKDAFHLISGSPKSYGIVGDNGIPSKIFFCGECSSLMWTEYSPRPDLRIVKAGTIDGDDALADEKLQPLVEQYTKRRAPWLCGAVNAKQYEGQQDASSEDDKMADVMLQAQPRDRKTTTMPAYAYTTDGLQQLVRHTAMADIAEDFEDIEIVTRRLSQRSYDPELNSLLQLSSESSLLQRRQTVRRLLEGNWQILTQDGQLTAVNHLAAAFGNIAAAGCRSSISITADEWSGEQPPYGADDIFRDVNAYVGGHFQGRDCGMVVVALLKASIIVNLPIQYLAFYIREDNEPEKLLKEIAAMGQPKLDHLRTLEVEIGGDLQMQSQTQSKLLSTIMAAAPKLETLSLDGMKPFSGIALGNISATIRRATLRTLHLTNVKVTQSDLLSCLNTQRKSLRKLDLDEIVMQDCSGWRVSLHWMIEHLTLEELEFCQLTCIDSCDKFSSIDPGVMCRKIRASRWDSHGIYESQEAAKHGLESLAEEGEYFKKSELDRAGVVHKAVGKNETCTAEANDGDESLLTNTARPMELALRFRTGEV
ncbi:hypothetical protein LTR56_003112 [Elasticomyces elasticus]|nr:hypothetical protein LTR22_014332 [Elasticomyces elasticus]KAK3656409.1 hypothetical protein LTR56_003112 [Elasticomyces elasticus]KAK5750145.1 hypothetical protein LTS12_019795 [Elasticomyces elasticus]